MFDFELFGYEISFSNDIWPIAFFVGFVVLWVYPVVRGIDVAREKNYSPAWMWFGIHPVTGWITYSVLKNLAPLKECPQCAEKVKAHAKVCPYCLHDYSVPNTR